MAYLPPGITQQLSFVLSNPETAQKMARTFNTQAHLINGASAECRCTTVTIFCKRGHLPVVKAWVRGFCV